MKRSFSLFFLVLSVFSVCAVSFAQPSKAIVSPGTVGPLVNDARYQGGNIQYDRPALTRDLVAAMRASRPAPDPVAQLRVVSLPGVKIAVQKEGMYRITRAELENAGFPIESDSTNWRLYLDGNEQAIIVGPDGQYIEFYGRGIDTFETDTRIYYLISDTIAGKRIVSRVLRSVGGNVVSSNYRFDVEKKEKVSYNSNIQNGDLENYFGRAVVSDPSTNLTFNLTGVDPLGPDARIRINLQGLTNGPHEVKVVINGNAVGFVNGDGLNMFGRTFVVPQSLVHEGTNSLSLKATTSPDVSYFVSVKTNYSRRYAANQNRVGFVTPGYRKFDVTGFTTPGIRVFDTTLDEPQEVVGLQIAPGGSTFTVSIPSSRPAVFYAVDDTALLQSPSVTLNNASTLATQDNSADMIIVTYGSPEFMAASETWANYRRGAAGGSFTVKVVDVADIFDEFSYGLHTSNAIKDFLGYARHNWQSPAPAYVLLLGDASYDRRNYEGFGSWDLVPTKNVGLIYEEAGSDDALADLDHDGVADLAIGRIPARNASDILTVLNKTMAFETPVNQILARGVLFPYDLPLGSNFQAECQTFRNALPRGMPAQFIARDEPMAHQNLIEGLNTGKYIVNFCGHSSATVWAAPAFFTIADVPALTNAGNPSIFTTLGSFTGLFILPNTDSLDEALLKAPNGGAAATWSSTTETTPDYQLVVGSEFYRLFGEGNFRRMGDLVNHSKLAIAGSEIGYSWNLLGDPALKVR